MEEEELLEKGAVLKVVQLNIFLGKAVPFRFPPQHGT